MIFASINWLEISINLLLVLFVVVCLLMTLIVLMQRPKQEGLGAAFGANVTDQVFGARTTNVLQRGTVYLGSMFFILAMTLSILVGMRNKHVTMISKQKIAAEKAAEAPKPAPTEEKKAPESKKPVAPTGEKPAPPPTDKAAAPVLEKPAKVETPAENKASVPAPKTEIPAPVPAPATEPKPEVPAPVPAAPAPPAPKPEDGVAPSPDKKPSP